MEHPITTAQTILIDACNADQKAAARKVLSLAAAISLSLEMEKKSTALREKKQKEIRATFDGAFDRLFSNQQA